MENDSKQFNPSPFLGVFLFAGIIIGLAIRNNFDIKSLAMDCWAELLWVFYLRVTDFTNFGAPKTKTNKKQFLK